MRGNNKRDRERRERKRENITDKCRNKDRMGSKDMKKWDRWSQKQGLMELDRQNGCKQRIYFNVYLRKDRKKKKSFQNTIYLK